MKHLLLFTFLWLGTLTSVCAQTEHALVVNYHDGTKISYLLSSRPHISYTKQNVVISANDTELSVSRTEVRSLAFEECAAGIVAPSSSTDCPTFSVEGDVLRVSGLASGSIVNVYGLDGCLLRTATTDYSGNAAVPLPSSVRLFVVKTSVASFKVVKK